MRTGPYRHRGGNTFPSTQFEMESIQNCFAVSLFLYLNKKLHSQSGPYFQEHATVCHTVDYVHICHVALLFRDISLLQGLLKSLHTVAMTGLSWLKFPSRNRRSILFHSSEQVGTIVKLVLVFWRYTVLIPVGKMALLRALATFLSPYKKMLGSTSIKP
jgi:hypothetical protein